MGYEMRTSVNECKTEHTQLRSAQPAQVSLLMARIPPSQRQSNQTRSGRQRHCTIVYWSKIGEDITGSIFENLAS